MDLKLDKGEFIIHVKLIRDRIDRMADSKQLEWFGFSLEMRGDTDLSEIASTFINFIARSRFLLWVTGYLLFSP